MHITEAAKIEIDKISQDSPFKISVYSRIGAGIHLDLISNAEPLPSDVTISSNPWIIADLPAITALTDSTIDFQHDEFVIRIV